VQILHPQPQTLHVAAQTVADALIRAIELAALLFGQDAVATVWRQQAGREGCVDFFEELKEDEADRVALADQSIATGTLDLLDQPFGAQFGKVTTEGGQRVLRLGLPESIQGWDIEVGGGKGAASGNVG
jgi:hypothetical protein